MSFSLKLTALAICTGLLGLSANADPAAEIVGTELLAEAMTAREQTTSEISNTRYLSIIDYRAPSRVPRFYLRRSDRHVGDRASGRAWQGLRPRP